MWCNSRYINNVRAPGVWVAKWIHVKILLLINKDFLTWPLISWRPCCSQSNSNLSNLCYVTWILTWEFLNTSGPRRVNRNANRIPLSPLISCRLDQARHGNQLKQQQVITIQTCIGTALLQVRPEMPVHMMTSSSENFFRVTGLLCGEFTGHRWIPRTKASDAELWWFLWSAPEEAVE